MASSSYWLGKINDTKSLISTANERITKLEKLKEKLEPIPEAIESAIETFKKIGYSLSAVCPAGYPIDNGSYYENAEDLLTAENDYFSLISECNSEIEAENMNIRNYNNSIKNYQNNYNNALAAEKSEEEEETSE